MFTSGLMRKKMSNRLTEIIEFKKKEIQPLKEELEKDSNHPLNFILKQKIEYFERPFFSNLDKEGLSVIAEIKRRSPSAGMISEIKDPIALALKYCNAGAAAVSVLTDKKYFDGTLHDLKDIAKVFEALPYPCPILRKDFVIEPFQIAEAKLAGANIVLLIVGVLELETKRFIDEAEKMGMEALVEVHNYEELKIAIDAKASIIGVNNRDLTGFKVNLDIARDLIKNIPLDVMKIAESGIKTLEDAGYMYDYGYDGILIGKLLVKSKDPGEIIARIGDLK